jgi:hypothetical protein
VVDDYTKGMLRAKDIYNSDDLARWAKSRGLLGVYISFRPKTTYLKAAWQVVMPGGKTDPNTIAVNKGRKTYTYESVAGKYAAQSRAMEWANHAFAGGSPIKWLKIEGFGADFFPESVIQELRHFMPDIVVIGGKNIANKRMSRKSRKS